LRVLGYATNGGADELALAMLAHLLDDLPIHVEITGGRLQASELQALVHGQGFPVVCFWTSFGGSHLYSRRLLCE
jgi:hypothetical protein